MPPAGSPVPSHLRPTGYRNRLRGPGPPRSLLAASRLLGAHPAPGFQRRPGARSSCGDWTPIPPSTGPSVRVACPAGAASRSGRPSGSPSWGDEAAGGAVGRGHGAAWAPGSAGRPVCSPRAGGHQARRLGRLPAERRGGPETTTWGQLHARRFFDPCLWCGRTQISRPGRKKCSL